MIDVAARGLLAEEIANGEAAPSQRLADPIYWSAGHRFLFRFSFAYLAWFCSPFSGSVNLLSVFPLPDAWNEFLFTPTKVLGTWAAVHVFRLHGAVTQYHETGSGDTTLNYVEALCFLAIAFMVALLWTALDRRRPNYETLYTWLRLLGRYTLSFTLLSYGFAKVFPLQFSSPSFGTLNERYGDSSPMHLVWTFMGASAGYRIFGGLMEVIPGVLLFFRRTTPLGLLLAASVMTNIVALNFFYDVPVKLYSAQLLLLCGFLLLPEVRVLTDVLVLRRASLPVIEPRVRLQRHWMRWGAAGLKIVLIGMSCWSAYNTYKDVQKYHPAPKPNELRGIWKVDSFLVGGQEASAGAPSGRWTRLAVGRHGNWVAELTYDGERSFSSKYDGNTASLRNSDDDAMAAPQAVLTWRTIDATHIAIGGTLDGKPVAVLLHGSFEDTSLLTNRGFHWISEDPYQR